MTNTIEQSRREMYELLSVFKHFAAKPCLAGIFEAALETHLEELRKAMVTINESTVSCAQHSAEAFLNLESRLARVTEERDILRNKLQAFEFANCSAAELLSEALREPSGLRKSSQAIPQPESVDRASCAKCSTVELRNPPITRKKCTHPWAWRTHSQADECFVCRKCGTLERDF